MKTCLISNDGGHDPPLHRMVVDGFGLLLDLKGVRISAVDPSSLGDSSIRRVEWGPVVRQDGSLGEQGVIIRSDFSRQTFFEKSLLNNYLDAFEETKAKLMADHAAAVEAEAAELKARMAEHSRQRQQYEAQEQHRRRLEAVAVADHAAKTREAADLAAEHARVAEKVAADIAAMKERHEAAERANIAFAAEQADIAADQAAITDARKAGTVQAFTEYLKKFQRHANEAMARIGMVRQ